MKEFKVWFEQKFLEWAQKRGKRSTLKDFADFLEVDQRLVSQWMSGKMKPGAKYIDKLAVKLGMEIYDVLGQERPDEDLLIVRSNWYKTPERAKHQIREIIEKYVVEPETNRTKRDR